MNPLCKNWDAKKSGPVPAIVCEVCREEHGGRCPLEKKAGVVLALAAAVLLAACGGGGGGGTAPPGREFLAWKPPTAFVDNTVLDPSRDLDYYEVLVSFDGTWDNVVPAAIVAAVDNAGNVATEFEIGLLRAHGTNPTDNGSLVTLRAVSIDGKASGPGAPALWEER